MECAAGVHWDVNSVLSELTGASGRTEEERAGPIGTQPDSGTEWLITSVS
jgi:hypothetical protein